MGTAEPYRLTLRHVFNQGRHFDAPLQGEDRSISGARELELHVSARVREQRWHNTGKRNNETQETTCGHGLKHVNHGCIQPSMSSAAFPRAFPLDQADTEFADLQSVWFLCACRLPYLLRRREAQPRAET